MRATRARSVVSRVLVEESVIGGIVGNEFLQRTIRPGLRDKDCSLSGSGTSQKSSITAHEGEPRRQPIDIIALCRPQLHCRLETHFFSGASGSNPRWAKEY